MADSEMLENLRRKIVDYYRFESNPHKSLVAEKTNLDHLRVLQPLEWDLVST